METYKIWPAKVLVSIHRMPGELRGTFSLLILHCLSEKGLPDDDDEMAFITGLPAECIAKIRPYLKWIATVQDGRIMFKVVADIIRETNKEAGIINLLRGDWPVIRLTVLERDLYTCGYCGKPATCVDHILSRHNGGSSDLDNLISACQPCNSKKRHHLPEDVGMKIQWKMGVKV